MTNLLCFKWVNLQKDSRFNFYVTVPKTNSMPLTPSQRSASKLKTTHSLYELLAHAVYLKKKTTHIFQMLKTLFSKNFAPSAYLPQTHLMEPTSQKQLLVTYTFFVSKHNRQTIQRHGCNKYILFCLRIQKQIPKQAQKTDFQKIYQMQFQPNGSKLETELNLYQMEVL